jgi:carboxylesterase type B
MLAHGTICTQPYSWDFNAKAQRRKDASEECWFLSQAGYGRYSQ